MIKKLLVRARQKAIELKTTAQTHVGHQISPFVIGMTLVIWLLSAAIFVFQKF